MQFKRDWSGCPRIWEQWSKEDGGPVWTIKDLPPEDDGKALELLIDNFLDDEMLCKETGITKDPASIRGCRQFWSQLVFPHRVSLACYRQEPGGAEELVALNGLVVKTAIDEKKDLEIEGEPANEVISILGFMETQKNIFEMLGVDKYLSGAGLVVSKAYRGQGLGAKLLNAREPLCKHLGISATATVFSGPYSQKSAAGCGFKTILNYTLRELHDLGFRYPQDDRDLKLMVKMY